MEDGLGVIIVLSLQVVLALLAIANHLLLRRQEEEAKSIHRSVRIIPAETAARVRRGTTLKRRP